LQAILDGGGDRVQVCSMHAVLDNEDIRKVFKEFFGKQNIKANQPATTKPDTIGK